MASVAGVCKELLESEDRAFTLAELHSACLAAGLDVEEVQVYAGIQSMASKGKADRGPENRTWTKLGLGRGAGQCRVADPAQPGPTRTRTLAKSKQTYPAPAIIAALTEKLGPPIERPMNKSWHVFALDGSDSVESILIRTRIVIGQEPDSWFTYMVGPTPMVGFAL